MRSRALRSCIVKCREGQPLQWITALLKSKSRSMDQSANGAEHRSANGTEYRSANGARYGSQGQARSEAERVAPGNIMQTIPALKGRNNSARISALQASNFFPLINQGRRASRLPLAFIFRAVGAPIPPTAASDAENQCWSK